MKPLTAVAAAFVVAFSASTASAQSYTTIILTESATSTTTIVLPAWPTTWTTGETKTTPTLTPYSGTSTSTATATTTTPATVPTAGAEAMMVLDRAAMGSMVLFVVLGLVVV